jgi:hypothetical protein
MADGGEQRAAKLGGFGSPLGVARLGRHPLRPQREQRLARHRLQHPPIADRQGSATQR